MKVPCAPRTLRLPKDLSDEANLLRAVADVHRLRILAMLSRADDDICVCDLNASLPLLQPTVSHHLKILKEAGLITSQRRGTWVYHRLASNARERLQRLLDIVLPGKVLT